MNNSDHLTPGCCIVRLHPSQLPFPTTPVFTATLQQNSAEPAPQAVSRPVAPLLRSGPSPHRSPSPLPVLRLLGWPSMGTPWKCFPLTRRDARFLVRWNTSILAEEFVDLMEKKTTEEGNMDTIRRHIQVARGLLLADLVLRNARLVNVCSGE